MSASTLPKSIQALQNESAQGGQSSRDRQQILREFIDNYKHLPDDFLRIPPSYYATQELENVAQTRALMAREGPLVDMIDFSVVEAQLVKNYGLLRMDLYCKIRVGHMVCETPTCPNGAKNPKWDGVYQFSLKPGLDSFHLEIYDEKQFSPDEKIAWLYEPIPPEVFQGITVERWFPLSGRLGRNKEGSILLVLSHKRVPMRASHFGRSIMQHHHQRPMPGAVFVPGPGQMPTTPAVMGAGGPVMVPQVQAYIQPTQAPQPMQPMSQQQQTHPVGHDQPRVVNQPAEGRQVSEEDINQLSEMFPSIDKAIIKSVLENNYNDKEAAIGALLAMG